jgi:CRISPR system Cascade subunit CasC
MTNDKAVDLAMFGRMLADLPEYNIDGACQEAHATSTHKIDAEIDFFTAVDEKQPEESMGAGMMGTVEFDAPCYYRYACIDMRQMVKNLGGDIDLAQDGAKAFIEAFACAIPGGKQNTFAAHNPPSMLLAVVRERGNPWNLLNAFERPVRPDRDGGMIAASVKALCDYWDALVSFYGDSGITSRAAALLKTEGMPEDLDLLKNGVSNLPEFTNGIITGLKKAEEGE